MSLNDQVGINVLSTLEIYENNYTIPGNTYTNIIYYGAGGNIILPNSNTCLNGQTLTIRNLGSGGININTQGIDVIRLNNSTSVITLTLFTDNTIYLNCNAFNRQWVEFYNISNGSGLIATDIYTTNISNGSSNVNIMTNTNLDAKRIFMSPVSIGVDTGKINQANPSFAIGFQAGETDMSAEAIAIGYQTGQTSQGMGALAIGYQAGQNNQGIRAIAIGYQAGQNSQGMDAIGIGDSAAKFNQALNAIAIGRNAGFSNQGQSAIAIGLNAGSNTQGEYAIAIGKNAADTSQGINAIAIGVEAGKISQETNAIAIGYQPGYNNQKARAIAIGYQAGYEQQAIEAISIGYQAGYNLQKQYAVAIGYQAGYNNQDDSAVAIGYLAGSNAQGKDAIAIGRNAGSISQASNCIHIGAYAGESGAKQHSIGIGYQAGQSNQGQYSIAIGYQAGQTNQPDFSIVLNATGAPFNPTAASAFYVRPVRDVVGALVVNLRYNSANGEIFYINDFSDSRIKKNVQDLNETECLTIMENIQPKKYTYIETNDNAYGFIAQDVQPYFSDAVTVKSNYINDIWQITTAFTVDKKLKVKFTGNIKVNDKIKILNNNTKDIYTTTVTEIDNDELTTDTIVNLYVSGNINVTITSKLVDDYLVLNNKFLWPISWTCMRSLLNRVKIIEQKLNIV